MTGRGRTDELVHYIPSPDVTPERELETLASVYRFVLDCHTRKVAALASRADGVKEKSNDELRAESGIPR
jgi:hypothetical protein